MLLRREKESKPANGNNIYSTNSLIWNIMKIVWMIQSRWRQKRQQQHNHLKWRQPQCRLLLFILFMRFESCAFGCNVGYMIDEWFDEGGWLFRWRANIMQNLFAVLKLRTLFFSFSFYITLLPPDQNRIKFLFTFSIVYYIWKWWTIYIVHTSFVSMSLPFDGNEQ